MMEKDFILGTFSFALHGIFFFVQNNILTFYLQFDHYIFFLYFHFPPILSILPFSSFFIASISPQNF